MILYEIKFIKIYLFFINNVVIIVIFIKIIIVFNI